MNPNRRILVKQSSIHGRGVFARRRLRAGAYIGTFEGDATTSDGEHVLWVLGDDDREYGLRGRNELRFLNHSRLPNAEFEGPDLFAIRNIQPGAEITFHYGDAWEEVE